MKKITTLLVFLMATILFAQAPKISCPETLNYVVGSAINPIKPTNSGGTVPANYGKVSKYAFSGEYGNVDGISSEATSTGLSGIIINNNGELYLVDPGSSADGRIRKVSTDGLVTTFAGNWKNASIDGIGTDASLRGPYGAAFDTSGNLFVTQKYPGNIRKITSSAVVTTFAGNGDWGDVQGDVDGTGINARFNRPEGIAIDNSGNIFVADSGNNKIKKISPSGVVTTFAGSGIQGNEDGIGLNATFTYPENIAIDKSNNLYVTTAYFKIRKITPEGVVSTFYTGNQNYSFIAVDSFNNIYVTTLQGSVLKFSPSGLESVLVEMNTLFPKVPYGAIPSGGSLDGLIVDKQNEYLYLCARLPSYSGYNLNTFYGGGVIYKINNLGYSITPKLPKGLNFDNSTGEISGIPEEAISNTNYTITAYNKDGSDSAVINISGVVPAPTGDSSQTFCEGAKMYNIDSSGPLLSSYYGGRLFYNTSTGGDPILSNDSLVDGKTYYIGQIINGTESIDRLAVTTTVKSTPSPTGDSSQTFCEGSLVSSILTSGTDVKWYTTVGGNMTINSTSQIYYNGTYYATQTKDGCESINRLPVNVSIISLPDPVITLQGSVLQSNVVIGNQWYKGGAKIDGATNQLYSPLESGTYMVEYTQNGCVSEFSNSISIVILDVVDFEKAGLTIYPNPTTSFINIKSLDEIKMDKMYVIDETGKIVLEQSEDSSILNVQNLPKGIYILKVLSGDKQVQTKFIKN